MAILNCSGLSVSRSGTPPLHFDDLSVKAGEKILLLGPSGSGKTTLLSVLAGLLQPTAGRVLYEGTDIYALSGRDRDRLRGRHFGFVFQTLHLLPSLTLRQNVALVETMAGAQAENGRIDRLLENLGLADKAHRKPSALSQGEQQRAAIARAVLLKPEIIIADEPTSALDDENAHIVTDLLTAQAQDTGAALLVATHDSRIAGSFDRIVRLDIAERKIAA